MIIPMTRTQARVERGAVPGDSTLGPEEPVVIKMNNQNTKLGPAMPVSPLPSSHLLGPKGPVSGNGRTWPEPNGSGRRGSAATGSGATVSILWLDVL